MRTLASISEDLSLFDDWMDKYAYLIDLGRELPPLPEAARTEENIVHGCTSKVWLAQTWEGETLHLQADSDAMIVKGLLAIILAAYHGKTKAEIAAYDVTEAFQTLGLAEHLTPNRRNGFASVVQRIRSAAV